jgi:hypothetical protein
MKSPQRARPGILFIGHFYHQVTKSSAFFLERLKLLGEVTAIFDKSAGGAVPQNYLATAAPYDFVVVWQLPKVISQFAGQANRKNIVYVPMFDAVHRMERDFWQSLKHIKIVCFSSTLRATCLTHRLDSFFIQYYPEWVELAPAGYSGKSLFFWQRRTTPNWETVSSILPQSQFSHMHHHVAIDPGFEVPPGKLVYPDASDLASGRVGSSDWFPDKADLIAELRRFNLFFLPREREGIGMSFLDAMTTGLIPVGFDRPTYNEYVVDGLNGFIVAKEQRLELPDLHPVALLMMHYIIKGRKNYLRRLKGLDAFLLRPVKVAEAPRRSLFQRGPLLFRRWANRLFATAGNARRPIGESAAMISIIVVVKNNISGFLATWRSICRQTFMNFELIVVDRGSTDGTWERVMRNKASIDQFFQTPGKNRSDAMDEATALAKGRYLLFFNAGDEFAGSTSLEEALQDAPTDAEIIYGHHYANRKDGSVKLMLTASLNHIPDPLRLGDTADGRNCRFPCQQAILVSREYLLSHGLSLGSRASQLQDFLRQACRQGARSYHSNTVIVRLVINLSSKQQRNSRE